MHEDPSTFTPCTTSADCGALECCDVAGGGHCSYNPTGDVDEEGLCLANVNQNVEVTNIGEVTTTPTEAATTTEPTSTTSAPVDDVTTTAAPAEITTTSAPDNDGPSDDSFGDSSSAEFLQLRVWVSGVVALVAALAFIM